MAAKDGQLLPPDNSISWMADTFPCQRRQFSFVLRQSLVAKIAPKSTDYITKTGLNQNEKKIWDGSNGFLKKMGSHIRIWFLGKNPGFRNIHFLPCSGHQREKLWKQKSTVLQNKHQSFNFFKYFFGKKSIFGPFCNFGHNAKTAVSPFLLWGPAPLSIRVIFFGDPDHLTKFHQNEFKISGTYEEPAAKNTPKFRFEADISETVSLRQNLKKAD